MSEAELYSKEARVWIPDPDYVWRGAELLEDYKGQPQLSIRYEDGEETKIKVKDKSSLPPLRNPDILIGENDLTSLSYLHEPAVLYNLQVRFVDRSDIYTYCGIVLVAINPYASLPIYDQDTIQAYSGQDMVSMDPHIFAVAEEAFKNMSRYEENQSLIVSGESGAGKTVSAKYAMRYLATVCGAETETQIEKKVLASNPIMEAIGNAKTTRNDNSSRFGKYIEIGFSKSNRIVGSHMRTYLLEKSRVVFQASEERNYHVFYQLCACVDLPEFEFLNLNHADVFYYTNQGEAPVIDGVDDAVSMAETREAFSLLGIHEARQFEIFRILSGILHLGNIVFQLGDKGDKEASSIPKTDKHLPIMAELLGINQEQMRQWLCQRKIQTAHEVLMKPLTRTQAYFARDALSKHIYSQLFDWIVGELNKALVSTVKTTKFIGILDIYGFETFEINSFEQFCINYANEKLQQQFCLHVFKLEQEEYVREEITWSFIDFYDNQPCIDLIEGKLGILDLLDEECKLPKGSDENWVQKLHTKHVGNKHFSKPRMSNTAFIIHHFADNVQYQMEGFLEKNRDTVLDEHINILKASEYELVAEIFKEQTKSAAAPPARPMKGGVLRPAKELPKAGKKSHRMTVGSQFRDSLNRLMETLFSTTPHYIRCIKPNDYKMAFSFEPNRAVQQLRACGVLETIRISAAGYPSRWTYTDFFQRYRVLAHSKEVNRRNMRATCEKILHKLIQDRDKYQFGKTKIFFRAGQVAYLEKLRSDRLRACGVLIQKNVRGWLARIKYRKIRKTVLLIQKYGRGLMARGHAKWLKRTRAATTIQKMWRGYRWRQKYKRVRNAVITVQSFARGLFGRQRFQNLRAHVKATVIQRTIRGWMARRQYRRVIRGIVLLQSHVRRRIARRELKRLKVEARSVEHIKSVAKGLENKIIELQQKLDERSKEVCVLREDKAQYNDLRNEFEKLKHVEAEKAVTVDKLAELEALVAKLQQQLEQEKGEKEKVLNEKNIIKKDTDLIIQKLGEENSRLKQDLENMNKSMKDKTVDNDSAMKSKVEEMRHQMLREFEQERQHHQKVLNDHARLQQRLENMQTLASPTGMGHRRNESSVSMISIESDISDVRDGKKDDDADEDLGYNSAQRVKLNLGGTSRQTSTSELSPPPTPGEKIPMKETDIPLVTRLQNRVKELEKEKARLRREIDRREEEHEKLGESDPEREIYDTIKLQELEMENNKIKQEMLKLRQSIAHSTDIDGSGKGSTAGKEFMDQFEAMTDELSRRREECIQLRTLLASRSRGMGSTSEDVFAPQTGADSNLLNEDGELEMAYKTQQDLNKLLEKELQRVQKNSQAVEKELRQQLDELKSDNERQQKLIGQNLTLTPEAKIEATMQHEITRLTSENLDLREMLDKHQEQIKKLKKALKVYAKRLKSTEASDVAAELEREMAADENLPAVKHWREREYSGMYEYRKDDEPLLIRNLIIDLKPRIAAQNLPGLPSYIMFMCIRHTDYLNDDEKVRSLLTNVINGVKKIVKKRQDDVDSITLWLANTCRLLHCFKQYSGEKTFQAENTPKQNEHCLRNFDLSEYRQILSDLAVWIYQGLIKLMQSTIHPMIVGAVLEHEAIAGLSVALGKPSGLRRGTSISSSRQAEMDRAKDFSLDSLIKAMNNFQRVLNVHAVDPELSKQVFRQLFYFVCANSLNNLLLRKDMCHWSKGMQIRYNLSHLEQWMRDNQLQDSGATQALEPIVQASQLLQARKTDTDVDSICEMCSRLSTSQIIKILNLYTPVNEFEERVPISFIRKIQDKLSVRQDSTQSLLMDTKFFYAVTFPFNPSGVSLETVVAPSEWGLGFLKRI